ncbi:MAG: hypothetical protein PHE51_03470 [Eubacteriales bacterium]|nr:hypothetical protein [Eubacteriales bacterium]
MKSYIKYELPIFSSSLINNPVVKPEDMNIILELTGFDEKDKLKKIIIQFNSVVCYKYTLAGFTPKLYNSYDKIVELKESEWLQELKNINQEKFSYWKPSHYIIYLDEVGMFQFIAKGYEVTEYE